MGIFDRRKGGGGPFWEIPPIATTDVALLRRHGFDCLARDDWHGAITSGWAIWRLAGLHQHQASHLLQGGQSAWRHQEPLDPRHEPFLWAVFERLESWVAAAVDPYSEPREVVDRVATPYAVRAWAAGELLEIKDKDAPRDFLLRMYSALAATPRDYVPIRSEEDGYACAEALGLPPPWR